MTGGPHTDLERLAKRTSRLHWDSPPENVGELLAEDWRKASADVLALLRRLSELEQALKGSRRGKHLPFCPGSLPKHNCWPECQRVRAALSNSSDRVSAVATEEEAAE